MLLGFLNITMILFFGAFALAGHVTGLAAKDGFAWARFVWPPNGTDWLTAATGGVPRLPACGLTAELGESDCGSWVAVPYFVCFQLVTFCLLLNAAIAVLLSNFTQEDPDAGGLVRHEDYLTFAAEWSRFDPFASRLVGATALPILLKRTPAPLGVRGNQKPRAMLRVLRRVPV